MKLFPFLFLAALSLSGCSLTTATPPQSITVQQAYFAELSTYYVLVGTAGQYKDDCMAREAHLQQDCRLVVQKLRDITIRAEAVRGLTDRAIAANASGAVTVATETLRDLLADMKKGLADPADQPQPQATPELPPNWTAPPLPAER